MKRAVKRGRQRGREETHERVTKRVTIESYKREVTRESHKRVAAYPHFLFFSQPSLLFLLCIGELLFNDSQLGLVAVQVNDPASPINLPNTTRHIT